MQNKRELILREFAKLYDRLGYEKTTLAQLSKACGLSSGHISFYYKKKEDLALQLNINLINRVEAIINEIVVLPEDRLIRIFFRVLIFSYIVNQDETRYMHMAAFFDNPTLLDKLIEISHATILRAFRQMKFPVDEVDIWTASSCSTCCYFMMVRHSYKSKLPLNYFRMFNLFCETLFLQIDFPELKEYQKLTMDFFDSIDKEVFMQKYREASMTLYEQIAL